MARNQVRELKNIGIIITEKERIGLAIRTRSLKLKKMHSVKVIYLDGRTLKNK